MKILLVDADAAQFHLFHAALPAGRHVLHHAPSSSEALSQLSAGVYDLVLVDTVLSDGVSGFVVAAEVGGRSPVFLRTNEDPEFLMVHGDAPYNVLAAFSKFDRPLEIVEHAEMLSTTPLLLILGANCGHRRPFAPQGLCAA